MHVRCVLCALSQNEISTLTEDLIDFNYQTVTARAATASTPQYCI